MSLCTPIPAITNACGELTNAVSDVDANNVYSYLNDGIGIRIRI